MLSQARARRLARRAQRRRADSSRGLLARRAWQALTAAGDQGDEQAAEAAWQAWLREPGDDLWDALSRWRGRPALAQAAYAAATDPGRNAAARAVIGEFCTGRGLAPAGQIERAQFYLLTGQAAQLRAADPDGRLLAAAYQAATEQPRTAMREALAGTGGTEALDLARVIGGRHSPGAGLTPTERTYLTAQLTGRRDWAGLWRLIRDLPLADAVGAVRMIGDGWRPADDHGRELLRRLAGTDPSEIGRAREALLAPIAVSIELDDAPTRGAFSPDGRQLLVAMANHGLRYRGCRVFDLPGGTLVERHDFPGAAPPGGMLHLGEAFLVVGRRLDVGVWELVRYAEGRPHVFHWLRRPMTALPYRTGFVVLKEELSGRCRLEFRDLATRILGEQTLNLGGQASLNGEFRAAVDQDSGLLAIGAESLWIVAADDGRVVARLPRLTTISSVCFTGSDTVATADVAGYIRLYQIADGRLLPRRWTYVGVSQPTDDLVAVPQWGEIALRIDTKPVQYRSALTLRQSGRGFADAKAVGLWGSVDGRSHAVGRWAGGHGVAQVLWGGARDITALADRPMGGMTLGDLSLAQTALHGSLAGLAARPFLTLLRDCLRQRLAMDVALGDTRPAAGATEIAMSGRGDAC
jgi:hypothetical protein